ncbi:hypothetical protein D3C75_698960 [compost metagenome]
MLAQQRDRRQCLFHFLRVGDLGVVLHRQNHLRRVGARRALPDRKLGSHRGVLQRFGQIHAATDQLIHQVGHLGVGHAGVF